MMYAPIRDRVFHMLDIQSSQKEYFLVSSPVAAQGLSMLGFPLAEMPVSVSAWRKRDESGNSNADRSKQLNREEFPNAPLIVQAWVGYSFGDTVLLCRWRDNDRARRRYVPFQDGYSISNACLPLALSELRRLSNVWPDKSSKTLENRE